MTPRSLMAHDPALLRESEFASLVVEVARLGGFKTYHTFNSRRSQHGFPDYVFVKAGRLVFAELKTEAGRVSDAQREWLDSLSDVPGVDVFVWKPSDWDEVVHTLTGRSPRKEAA